MSLYTDPRYRALAIAAARILGTSSANIVNAILAQWACEKGQGDAYPPFRNNPGNLARGAAHGLGYPFYVQYPNPQPSNPIVTFYSALAGAKAYATLLKVGSRYAGVRAAARAGNGRAFCIAMGASGYGTSARCMLSVYRPATVTRRYVCSIPKGARLYVRADLRPTMQDILIDPGPRTMPYLGTATPSAKRITYVNASGVNTGRTFFVRNAACLNIRAV